MVEQTEQTQVQQVTTKDPKKGEQGKTLAEHNNRKREELAHKSENETNLTYYSAGAIVAIGVLGGIGYYIYKSKTPVNQTNEAPVHQPKETPANKSEME